MPGSSPQADYKQEVRFAVVMYGGVSLAIYINGVAQELLRLVRSTSSTGRDAQGNNIPIASTSLTGTEKVYRRLSCLLSDPYLLRASRTELETTDQASNGADIVDKRVSEETVNTRFVVDILSGTSAGGINAIYLAKALANNQSLDELKKLWVTEGDLGLLINDKQSVAGLHLTTQIPPQSLLNSRRMYFKLLDAFHGMEKVRRSEPGNISPHVDELDLFITTTDIEGLPLPLRLSDTVVYERRHRSVFHFKYGTKAATGYDRNDFLAQNDPFLAFAARCTSSFPFAFEPMRLCDIDEVLDRFSEYNDKNARAESLTRWKSFFRENRDALTGKQFEINARSFGDGGYLDNKPFTYATETLTRRDAPVPIDRKLIYIEPSPEHPEDEPPRTTKYQALENVKAALVDLPTYETIREDLQQLIDRNELLKRVNRITRAIEVDLDKSKKDRPKLKEGEWVTLDLADMARIHGIYYIPYRRLRIAATTDELAKLVARSRNLDENSAQFSAIRYLILAWREVAYPDYKSEPSVGGSVSTDGQLQPKTSNHFLQNYDYKYWLRRLTFVRNKVDDLSRLIRLPGVNSGGDGVDTRDISATDASVLERLKLLKHNSLYYSTLTGNEKRQLHLALSVIKCELNELYRKVRMGGRRIERRNVKNASKDEQKFAAAIESINLERELIEELLGLPKKPEQKPDEPVIVTQQEFSKLDETACIKRARQLLFESGTDGTVVPTELGQTFITAGETLATVFYEEVSGPAWERGRQLLKPSQVFPEKSERCQKINIDTRGLNSAREYLWQYFSQFDDYDQISYPILYGNDVGEADVVEIFRISPEDATSLINERAERLKPNGRKKLAGTALHHFGAFLDKVWRQNDILWGRLDGAERLITALLPNYEDSKVREKLINEAHTAILLEELTPETRVALSILLTDALVRVSAGDDLKAAVEKVIKPLRDETLRTRLTKIMQAGLENETLLTFIKSNYEVNRELDPKVALRSISRSTQVIGKMFEDMADQRNLSSKRVAWIARMGQVFWGLVEVAVPGSLLNLFFFHWIKVLYAFELLLLVGAVLLGAEKPVKDFAWTALAITATVNIVVLLLRDYIRGRKPVLRALVVLFILLISAFAALGLSDLFGWGLKSWVFWALDVTRNWLLRLVS